MMYDASLQIHYWLVFLWMGIVAFNAAMLQLSVNAAVYVRRARIAMPFSVMALFAIAFTGAVMMAAKHLDFTAENIAMIAVVAILGVLESRRYRVLRRLRTKVEGALAAYRTFALKVLGAELLLTLVITGWMGLR